MADRARRPNATYVMTVDKFLTSHNDSTSVTVCDVQSQMRSQGLSRSHAFRLTR